MSSAYKNTGPVAKIIKFTIFAFFFIVICSFFAFISVFLQKNRFSQHILSSKELSQTDIKYSCVIIDAGHGGEDGGAVSDLGIKEKDINLDIALKLQDLLSLSSVKTVMIRDTDRLMYEAGQEKSKKYYDISNRISIAEHYNNAILISIHQNKFPIKKYSGFQVYCSPNNKDSEVLAEIMQNNVKMYLQTDNNRNYKVADKNIRLLHQIKIPAIIAECGFLSNDNEAKLLSIEQYRNKIAYLIATSVMQFLSK